MAKKMMRLRGGFRTSMRALPKTGLRPISRAQSVVELIKQAPGGPQLVSAAKNAVRQRMGTKMNAAIDAVGSAMALAGKTRSRAPRKIFQDILMGQGTTQSFAQLGAYRATTNRVTAKTLSERRTQTSNVITSLVGKQGILNLTESLSATALNSMASQVDTFSANGKNSYIDPIASVTKNYFTNQDVGNVILYIYDYVARRDHNVNPVTAAQDITNSAVTQTFEMSAPGQTLFDSITFTNLFKIWKVTRVELRPGQSHIHQSRVFNKRKLNGKDFLGDADTVTNEFVRGVSSGVLVLAQSLPVVDSRNTTDNFGDDVVTFGSARVLFIGSKLESIYVGVGQNVKQVFTQTLSTTVASQRTRQDDGNIIAGENN